jgi:regulator of protease activity HflC (stomatin/prohibitin superfamily)
MALPGRQYMGRVDPLRLGERLTWRFRQGIERALVAREAYPNAKIVDVLYSELAADPLATTCSALRQLGHTPSSQHRAAMERFLAAQRVEGRTVHRYRAETYGLRPDALHEAFAGYMQRYRVPSEA